jgi:membrane-associated phospholipid phosphatase
MIRRVYPFLLLFCLFLAAGAWLLLTYTKAQLVLAVNGHYYPLGDAIMPYWTDWGDGATAVIIVVALIVFARMRNGFAQSIRYGLLGGLVFAIPSLLSLVIKVKFFDNEPRPATYFAATPWVLHHIDGVRMWLVDSFPSGHTITAFSMALLFLYLLAERPRGVGAEGLSGRAGSAELSGRAGAAELSGRVGAAGLSYWAWSIGLFAWACSVGYSRMYLAQHFFRDVYWGAIIGVVSGMGSIWLGEWLFSLRKRRAATP